MRIKDPVGEHEEAFNLVPLTDMVFNLLIFFMAATTFASEAEKQLALQLPRTSSTFTPISAPPKQITINIKQDGTYVVGNQTFAAPALLNYMKSEVQRAPTTVVIIRADERTIMKFFAGAASICKQSGVNETKIVYVEEQGKAP